MILLLYRRRRAKLAFVYVLKISNQRDDVIGPSSIGRKDLLAEWGCLGKLSHDLDSKVLPRMTAKAVHG